MHPETAVEIYKSFSWVNIIECNSAEILFRRSQALAASGQQVEAAEYLEQAYADMMRVYNFIPPESNFRQSYLENLMFHREIRAGLCRADPHPQPG